MWRARAHQDFNNKASSQYRDDWAKAKEKVRIYYCIEGYELIDEQKEKIDELEDELKQLHEELKKTQRS